MPSNVSVNIKMYRVGELGDCFLLQFKNGAGIAHVLIDCGSFRNGKVSIARMRKIATDIKNQLNGSTLDVIVGTHQHNDHLSGFVHAKDIFESISVGRVWLSWLDDPTDKKAHKIGKDYNNYLTNLRLIGKQLRSHFGHNKVNSRVQELLGFFGAPEIYQRRNAKTDKLPPALPAQARDLLRKIGKQNPKYLNPGEILSLPGIGNDVKVYVLGPPKKEDLLYDKDPNKDETYDLKLAANGTTASRLLKAMKQVSGSYKPKENGEPDFPIDEPYSGSKNFDSVWNNYYHKETWRQIPEDWINQAEQLALWLDGFTNNSSLVLAFELVKTNKVLLFAADAQTGNWNSWKEIKWKKMPKDFSWLSLMNNTVVYKTGHHGSHNSTLVEGLNNMTHEELVVLIPVDKKDPNITKKNGWKMPARNLYEELKKRSQDRIIRMDEGISTSSAWQKLPGTPKKNNLYCEYDVSG